MWLLNTKELVLEYFSDAQVQKQAYAILSHAWGPDEILFHEVRGDRAAIKSKGGWIKTTHFCAVARKYGLAYAWIDTCCIDKQNSADLSEAINSMYRYYYDAAACFIYLEDVHKNINQETSPLVVEAVTRDQLLARVRTTRWLSRGWTLQELLAPARRCFFAADWSEIEGGDDLLDAIAESAGISKELLEDRSLLRTFCVGERMKWASKRQTTREEDIAYCLAGIFNVSMPVLYGEGARNAFRRLQLEIMQTSFDMTIFAWRGAYESSGLLAGTPADFGDVPPLEIAIPWIISPYSMTNTGLSIRLPIVGESDIDEVLPGEKQEKHDGTGLLAALQCDAKTPTGQWEVPMIYLEPVKGSNFFVNGNACGGFRRVRCNEWTTLPFERLKGCFHREILVLEDEHYELVRQMREQHVSRIGI